MIPEMIVREATPDDLDQVTEVGMRGCAMQDHWPWRFEHAAEFPEEHLKFSRNRYLEFIVSLNKLVMVVETACLENPKVNRVVSVSIWHIPQLRAPPPTPDQKPLRLPPDNWSRPDANPHRLKEWRTKLIQGQKKLFDDVYGEAQLHLVILSTHPDYQRRGAGTMLIGWGKEKAKAENLTIVVTATPMGGPLYKKLGFREVGNLHFQVEGEKEFVDLTAFVFEQ